ncbi:hypothetical protein FHX42_005262 [Saccharopolyspora lacisalsi]|uniref:Uncharacterized protein n=1 Tax=Halosaccharopolyspora lacisalsi TaxID=1000566 RepID=A0A839E7G7_9PSEU|nr:hypothetical protein [Halosaccharopolyspora lacisalsi]MBA8827855.1 hypothetical protein [Halosaccharopolyspora lacisalsi]
MNAESETLNDYIAELADDIEIDADYSDTGEEDGGHYLIRLARAAQLARSQGKNRLANTIDDAIVSIGAVFTEAETLNADADYAAEQSSS